MNIPYRPGAIGALMDEYERAGKELTDILETIDTSEYSKIVDPDTRDADCRSMETIMNHVVAAGYRYANYIRALFGESQPTVQDHFEIDVPEKAIRHFNEMMVYTVQTLSDKWDLPDSAFEGKIIQTSWGQHYDTEQMLEHAIVHVLRHRRQIERFLLAIR